MKGWNLPTNVFCVWKSRQFIVEAGFADFQQYRLKCQNYSKVSEAKKCRSLWNYLQQRYEQKDDAVVDHEQWDTKMIHVVTAKCHSVPVL